MAVLSNVGNELGALWQCCAILPLYQLCINFVVISVTVDVDRLYCPEPHHNWFTSHDCTQKKVSAAHGSCYIHVLPAWFSFLRQGVLHEFSGSLKDFILKSCRGVLGGTLLAALWTCFFLRLA